MKEFDQAALQELAGSIQEHGVIQPILVEEGAGGTYLLQAGERRLRAAKMAGLKEIPAVIRPGLNGSGPVERLVLAMTENLIRADMNPIDEGHGYEALQNLYGLNQVEISKRIGVPLSRVSTMMNYLKLEVATQELVKNGTLSKDPRVTHSLLKLEKGDQVKVATALAARRAGPAAALEAITRRPGAPAGEKFSGEETPALKLAYRKGEPNKTQWNALQQVGRIPPWLLVEVAAREVCANCSLRDQASSTTCRGCALVEMLVGLIGKANNGGH